MKFNGVISRPVINTDVVSEPVSLAEIKDHLRISHSSEDTWLTTAGKAARLMLQEYTGQYFAPVNITVTLRNGLGKFILPYAEVGDAEYTDEDANVLDDLEDEYDGVITATFDTGYTTLPEDLKLAILSQVAFMYNHRGDDNSAGKMSEGAKYLAANYRWI